MTTPTSTSYWEDGMSSLGILTLLSILIAAAGTASNLVSLTYFLAKISTTTHQTLTPKLFLVLNLCDVMVTISTCLTLWARHVTHYAFFRLSTNLFYVSVFASSFLTCLLAVVRAININFPLLAVNWNLVRLSIVFYSLVGLVIQSTKFYYEFAIDPNGPKGLGRDIGSESSKLWEVIFHEVSRVEFLILASLFLVVVVANLVSFRKLFHSKSHQETCSRTRRATVTVGLISTIYCMCNAGNIILYGINLFSASSSEVIRATPNELINTFTYVFLPLNSAANPAVYLARTAEMRAHLRDLWRKCAGICSDGFHGDKDDSVVRRLDHG